MKKLLFILSILTLTIFISCGKKKIDINNGNWVMRINSKNIVTREVEGELYTLATLNKVDEKTFEAPVFYDDNGFKYINTDEYYSDNVRKVIREYDEYACFISEDNQYGKYLASEFNNDIIYDKISDYVKYKLSNDVKITLLNQIDQDAIGIIEVHPTINEYFSDEFIKNNTQPDLFSLCNIEVKNGEIINMKYIYEP